MRLLLLVLLVFAPLFGLAQEALDQAPTFFERSTEVYDTVVENWDVFLSLTFSLLTATAGLLELATRLKKTNSPEGFTTRAGALIDKLLAWFPNRIKEKAKPKDPA